MDDIARLVIRFTILVVLLAIIAGPAFATLNSAPRVSSFSLLQELDLQGQVVFSSDRNNDNRDLFILDAATDDLTWLTQRPFDFDAQPKWSPDGSRIAFASDDIGNQVDIFVDRKSVV